jgi:multidrug efflux pump subunit AcrA (membrane-fusion protein)
VTRAFVLIAAFLALPAFTGCARHDRTETRPAAVPVTLARVRTVAFAASTDLAGTVTAPHSVVVGATTAGRVLAVRVQVGDRVAAGETLARIDQESYRAAFAQAAGTVSAASGNLAVARAQVPGAQARLALAKATAARMAALAADGDISRQQNDEAQSALAQAQSALVQARAGVVAAAGAQAQAAANVAAARVPLAQSTVVAPFAGLVTGRAVEPGAVVGSGSPVVTIEDERALELDVAVPEQLAAALRPGAAIPVRVDALGGAAFTGTVRAVVPASDPALRSVTLKVALAARDGLVTGMFARVVLDGATRRTTVVPLAALVNRAGQDGVFTVRDGRAEFVPVRAGSVHGDEVEIADPGAPVAFVAVGGVERLTDGVPVSRRT